MKFDWKHWLPHFITWFLLLVLIGLVIRRELERKRVWVEPLNFIGGGDGSNKGRKKPDGKPPKKKW